MRTLCPAESTISNWFTKPHESNVGVGGPDLLPFRPFQLGNSYPLIRQSAGVILTGIAVQDGNYGDLNRQTGKRADISELLKFATDFLKIDYIFWCTEEPYYTNELIPFMRSARGQRISGTGTSQTEDIGRRWLK